MSAAITPEALAALAVPPTNAPPAAEAKRPFIGIAMPIAEAPHYNTFVSLLAAIGITRAKAGLQVLPWTDAPVAEARNAIVGQMLKDHPHLTHLMWIDDDMVFEPDAILRLLARDEAIVGGVCHNRRHPFMPILMRFRPKAEGGPDLKNLSALTKSDSKSLSQFGFIYDYEKHADARGLVEVDGTGAAFILVKREVYEKIAEKLDVADGEGPYSHLGGGEDISFCTRAKQTGFHVWVDSTLQIGHMGEAVVDDNYARRNRDVVLMPWYDSDVYKGVEKPTDDIRMHGLRINGFEVDDEGRRHRNRYTWAGRKLARMFQVGTVLDYGCGVGYGCKLMNRTAAEVGGGIAFAGFDVDEAAIEFGRKWWWEQITNDPAALDGGPYKAITSFEVIEHVTAHPRETLMKLLALAPIVIGSVPYKEPAGFNKHHVHSMLDESILTGLAGAGGKVEVFGETWDGQIGKLDPDRAVNPIMLFVVRR
jgi:SAM-dependent methyltransferase